MAREKIAIDAWGTYVSPEGAKKWPPEFLHIFRKYKCPSTMFDGAPLEAMLAEMDAAGVDRIVLSAFFYGGQWVLSNEEVAELVRRHPDRFIGAGTVNIMQKPMQVVREVEYLVKKLGLRCLRLEPYKYGDGMTGLPPNDKHYWPVYMKCSELGVAVAIQVGHTGPLLPSECGRPIYLDEVALSFPDLTILGCHVGQPWHEEMMVLAWKHPNVYLETSARGPRRQGTATWHSSSRVRVCRRSRRCGPSRTSRPCAHSRRCLLYTSPSPRDRTRSRMPSSA